MPHDIMTRIIGFAHGFMGKAGIAIGAMLATATGGMIEDHAVSLSTVSAVGSVVFAGVWWISSRFTRIDDRLKEIEKSVAKLPCVREREGTPPKDCPGNDA